MISEKLSLVPDLNQFREYFIKIVDGQILQGEFATHFLAMRFLFSIRLLTELAGVHEGFEWFTHFGKSKINLFGFESLTCAIQR